jgi:hypothetical protein
MSSKMQILRLTNGTVNKADFDFAKILEQFINYNSIGCTPDMLISEMINKAEKEIGKGSDVYLYALIELKLPFR